MVMDGKTVSAFFEAKLIEERKKIKSARLSVIQIGSNSASNIYIAKKEAFARKLNIEFSHYQFNENIQEEKIVKLIKKLNKEKSGIIIQLPIPKHLDKEKLINTIDPNLDVDGLTYINQGRLMNNKPFLIPCTPFGILKILEYYKIDVISKKVVVVGKSNLVGLPIANLLMNMGATVTVCHSKTVNLKEHTKSADILVVAAGVKHLIKADMVKKGVVVIDVGINKEDKIYGDVDYNKVSKKTSYITPVPGGVGLMTVTMLMYNVIKASGGFND